jgi:hypothetical protein
MKLENWIENEVDSEELLPLCHTTRWKYFEKILDVKILSTKFSKFPDPNPTGGKTEEMVYLFYGLPFYIYEVGDGVAINSEVTEDMPIGLIFKPHLCNDVDRFYPFDTGALLANKYKGILDAKDEMEYKLFEVPISDGKELKKAVKRYYCTNLNYCIGELCNKNVASHPKEENLLRLLNLSTATDIDLRSRAIEVHSLNDISLENNLQAIILPKFKSRKYKYLVDKIKIEYPTIDIEYYVDFNKFSSQSIRATVLQKVVDYYDSNPKMQFTLN